MRENLRGGEGSSTLRSHRIFFEIRFFFFFFSFPYHSRNHSFIHFSIFFLFFSFFFLPPVFYFSISLFLYEYKNSPKVAVIKIQYERRYNFFCFFFFHPILFYFIFIDVKRILEMEIISKNENFPVSRFSKI